SAQPSPRRYPRRAASARFSAIDMPGAVPLNGFWKTRPMNFALRCSGQRVTSRSFRRMVPASTKKLPATALSSVDFPEPFVPMTITNSARSMSRLTPRSARTSLGVSAWNVLVMPRASSMVGPPLHPVEQPREHQRDEDEAGGDQLQVVRVHPPAQGNGDQQP